MGDKPIYRRCRDDAYWRVGETRSPMYYMTPDPDRSRVWRDVGWRVWNSEGNASGVVHQLVGTMGEELVARLDE